MTHSGEQVGNRRHINSLTILILTFILELPRQRAGFMSVERNPPPERLRRMGGQAGTLIGTTRGDKAARDIPQRKQSTADI